MDTSYWTIFNHITIWGSLLFYFILDYSYNYTIQGAYVGTLTMAMNEAIFWYTTLITVTILTIPVLAVRFYLIDVKPSLSDRVRLKQRLAALKFRLGFTFKEVGAVLFQDFSQILFHSISDLDRHKMFSELLPFVEPGVLFVPVTLSLTRKVSVV